MSKRHVLLWSGGFDSTAILLNMISRPEEYPSVRVISCGLKNANNFLDDKKSREVISKALDLKNRPNITWEDMDVLDFNGVGGMQATIWAWLSAMNVTYLDTETVFVYGFIRGDDFWHYRNSFESAVRNLVAIKEDGVSVSFSYPLEWKYKKEFVNWYLHYPEVFYGLSWGGDTATIKAKEKEELEFLYNEILTAFKSTPKQDEQKNQETGPFGEGDGI